MPLPQRACEGICTLQNYEDKLHGSSNGIPIVYFLVLPQAGSYALRFSRHARIACSVTGPITRPHRPITYELWVSPSYSTEGELLYFFSCYRPSGYIHVLPLRCCCYSCLVNRWEEYSIAIRSLNISGWVKYKLFITSKFC